MTAVSEQCQSRKRKGIPAEWALLGKYSQRIICFRIKESSHASKKRDHVTLIMAKVKNICFFLFHVFTLSSSVLVVWFDLGWELGEVFGLFLFVFKFNCHEFAVMGAFYLS